MTDPVPSKDPRLSEIRKVELFWRESSPTSYLIHESEIDTFVEATKRLHFSPGKNPHNGGATARIYQITVGSLVANGPYWWTGPGLGTDDQSGAHIIDCYAGSVVWQDEEFVAALDEAEDD